MVISINGRKTQWHRDTILTEILNREEEKEIFLVNRKGLRISFMRGKCEGKKRELRENPLFPIHKLRKLVMNGKRAVLGTRATCWFRAT